MSAPPPCCVVRAGANQPIGPKVREGICFLFAGVAFVHLKSGCAMETLTHSHVGVSLLPYSLLCVPMVFLVQPVWRCDVWGCGV